MERMDTSEVVETGRGRETRYVTTVYGESDTTELRDPSKTVTVVDIVYDSKREIHRRRVYRIIEEFRDRYRSN